MRRFGTLLVLAMLGVPGCSSDVQPSGSGGAGGGNDGDGGDDGDGGNGGDGSGGDGGGTVQPPQGLFDCNLPVTCGDFTQHAAMVMGSGSPTCIAELAFSDGIGSTIYRDAPGPYIFVDERLIIYTGDGFAIQQRRHKECMCHSDPPWEAPSPVERCEVALHPDIEAACAASDEAGCFAYPPQTLTNCVVVAPADEPTCAELGALLAQR